MSEPTTQAGRRLADYLERIARLVDRHYDPADILEIERQARADRDAEVAALDVGRLAKALVASFRALAIKDRTDLHGHGWPAYVEYRNGHETTVTMLVSVLANAIATEYAGREAGGDAREGW